MAMRIFVLSDTHNRLPETLKSLSMGADEIWHLGDVCAPALLREIEGYGPPVLVVAGNCDGNPDWPVTRAVTRCGVRFQLIHIPPAQPPKGVDFVLHGHTHVPRDEVRGGVRFLNPGCVTRPNRGARPSVALLELSEGGEIAWQLLPLA